MEIQAIGRKIAFHSGFIMNEIAKRSFSIHPLGSSYICPLSQGLVCALRVLRTSGLSEHAFTQSLTSSFIRSLTLNGEITNDRS
jgi:hypothetical protein